MKFSFKQIKQASCKVLICFVTEEKKLSAPIIKIDRENSINAAMKADSGFLGKAGQILTLFAPNSIEKEVLLVAGLGKIEDINESSLQGVGGHIATKLNNMKLEEADLLVADGIPGLTMTEETIATNIALGIKLRNYIFDKYYVAKKSEHALSLDKINILANDPKISSEQFAEQEVIADGVLFTRMLVAEPANYLYPESFAQKCEEFTNLGVKVKVLGREEMQKFGMNALLGVAQGSSKEPKLVIMEWNGASNKNDKPIAFVGKGVTFDTGGINLKSSTSIAEMKYDMGGAGVVAGLIKSLAERKAKVNVIGVLGLVENMPSGTAQRPSDVVVSMSGQTIEVDNTDAEGRLVLADAIWYTHTHYNTEVIIDLATLTGAVVVALGDLYAGLFSNNDKLAEQLRDAGKKTGEMLWRLPLDDYYDKQINSEIADVRNTGQHNRGAGSTAAAQFLQRFTDGHKWAHLDIAGVAWTKFGSDICPKGATGFGVRLLNQFIKDCYE